jgi:hypothetical protein
MQIEVRNIVQWYAIFFYVKFDENATTAHGNLRQTFGNNAVSRAQTLHWHKMFSEGRTLVEDEQHSG